MSDEISLNSLIEVKQVDGVAATANIDIRPAEGEMYDIIDVVYWHDDPAGLDVHLEYQDNANSTAYYWPTHAALALNTKVSLRIDDTFVQPFQITRDKWVRLKATGIAAGKKGYINAIVRVIKGLPDDLGA